MFIKATLVTILLVQTIYAYPGALFATAPCATAAYSAVPFSATPLAATTFFEFPATSFAYDATPCSYGPSYYGTDAFKYGMGYDGFAWPYSYGSYGLGYPAAIY